VIEQAKGILMARHAIDADRAFEMLRNHSQRNGHKLSDVAAAVVDSHLLLIPPIEQQPAAKS
jgi:AmiR/NasT family two-component response regulator